MTSSGFFRTEVIDFAAVADVLQGELLVAAEDLIDSLQKGDELLGWLLVCAGMVVKMRTRLAVSLFDVVGVDEVDVVVAAPS